MEQKFAGKGTYQREKGIQDDYIRILNNFLKIDIFSNKVFNRLLWFPLQNCTVQKPLRNGCFQNTVKQLLITVLQCYLLKKESLQRQLWDGILNGHLRTWIIGDKWYKKIRNIRSRAIGHCLSCGQVRENFFCSFVILTISKIPNGIFSVHQLLSISSFLSIFVFSS